MQNLDLDIPESCGVMLLNGSALFPNSSMDLHIFEPRYRAMLEESLEDTWMFAIGNLIEDECDDLSECVSEVGTLALINLSKTLPDGRSAVVITGLYPIRFEQWERDSIYPQAKFSILERVTIEEAEAETIKQLLMDALPAHLEHLPSEVQSSVIENLESIQSISALMDNLAHNFISDTDFRHEMMCEVDDRVRASKLISSLSL